MWLVNKYRNKAFLQGHESYPYWGFVNEAIKKFISDPALSNALKLAKRTFEAFTRPARLNSINFREPGYALLQEYIPNCHFDLRVIIGCGRKAWAIKRAVRKHDFRASGSGVFSTSPSDIPTSVIEMAFETAEKLGSTFVAFDFLLDKEGTCLLVEYSYGIKAPVYDGCPGYWNRDLTFTKDNRHLLEITLQDWINGAC